MKPIFQQASWQMEYQITSEQIEIVSSQPLKVITSAIVGGEEPTAKRLLNRHVHKSYCPDNPIAEVNTWLMQKGIPLEETVVLLTAALVEQAGFQVIETETFRLAVWATAGIGNATRAGKDGPIFSQPISPGTINLIILVDGEMTSAAMINSIITATEAKAAALQDLEVRDATGEIATGTSTDAIVIASTQQRLHDYLHHYAGVISPLGQAIAKAVYQTVKEAIGKEIKGESSWR